MKALTPARLGACLVAMLTATAIAAPVAHATITNQLDVGAQLLDQPKGQPWAVNLLLGAKVIDSDGQAGLPITKKFTFQFPKANVNSSAFTVCHATDGNLLSKGPSACPAASQVGGGTADVRALSLPFAATVKLFNGPGTNKKRQLILYANATTVDVTVILHGTLTKTNNGNYGYTFDLPIPPIQVLQDQFVAIEGFNITVGKRITVHGRKVSFIDAPTKCSGDGWPFTFRDELDGGVVANTSAAISCVIKAT